MLERGVADGREVRRRELRDRSSLRPGVLEELAVAVRVEHLVRGRGAAAFERFGERIPLVERPHLVVQARLQLTVERRGDPPFERSRLAVDGDDRPLVARRARSRPTAATVVGMHGADQRVQRPLVVARRDTRRGIRRDPLQHAVRLADLASRELALEIATRRRGAGAGSRRRRSPRT